MEEELNELITRLKRLQTEETQIIDRIQELRSPQTRPRREESPDERQQTLTPAGVDGTSPSTQRVQPKSSPSVNGQFDPNPWDRAAKASPTPWLYADKAGTQIQVGHQVTFQATKTTRGGTGTVTGFTRGSTPFLRIRRIDAPKEEVKRLPKSVRRIQT